MKKLSWIFIGLFLSNALMAQAEAKVVVRDAPKDFSQWLIVLDGMPISYEEFKEIPQEMIKDITILKADQLPFCSPKDTLVISTKKPKKSKKKKPKGIIN